MKKKILILIALIFSLYTYSQKKERVDKQYVDSITNSIESKISKEIKTNILSVYKDINDILKTRKSIAASIDTLIKENQELNLKIQKSSSLIDSLMNSNKGLEISLNEQLDDFNKNISKTTSSLNNKTDSLTNIAEALNIKTDDLNKNLSKSNSNITQNSEGLNSTKVELEEVSIDLDQKGQTGIIIFSFSLILILIVYIFLNKKWNNQTKKLSLNQKEILEKQIEDSQKLADWLSVESSKILPSQTSETDHSFAKRVADEVVRMTNNLSRMDDSIKGFKQLSASVRKLIQSLSINEYEIEELLNKPYNAGMNLEANFVFNENIQKGSMIITRIIKPQINYKGKMIQAAQIEVSQND